RKLGKDVTAFIGVSIGHPRTIDPFEETVARMADVHECHHVTGGHTVLLKVKTHSTASLERLIGTIRLIHGVTRTETMVVLSTHTERSQIATTSEEAQDNGNGRRARHAVARNAAAESKRAQ
ncbi:MAG: Lrp/AsnC family transcriptional regulator, partial [Candidatus Binataceae bacterium]